MSPPASRRGARRCQARRGGVGIRLWAPAPTSRFTRRRLAAAAQSSRPGHEDGDERQRRQGGEQQTPAGRQSTALRRERDRADVGPVVHERRAGRAVVVTANADVTRGSDRELGAVRQRSCDHSARLGDDDEIVRAGRLAGVNPRGKASSIGTATITRPTVRVSETTSIVSRTPRVGRAPASAPPAETSRVPGCDLTSARSRAASFLARACSVRERRANAEAFRAAAAASLCRVLRAATRSATSCESDAAVRLWSTTRPSNQNAAIARTRVRTASSAYRRTRALRASPMLITLTISALSSTPPDVGPWFE